MTLDTARSDRLRRATVDPRRRATPRRPSATAHRHAPASIFLRVHVVEVAKHTLQLLQGGQDALEIGCIVEGRRDVDQVAQFLGVMRTSWSRAASVCSSMVPALAAIRRLRRQARCETTSARRRPALAACGSDEAGRLRNASHSESSRR